MKQFLKKIKCLFFGHIYGDGDINPFIDSYGNHSAIYTCLNCGHKKFQTFEKN